MNIANESAHKAEVFHEKRLDQAISEALEALLSLQHADGHWCFELESDCTASAEYILMMHYMDEIDHELQESLAIYIRAQQTDHGGWPLYFGGHPDISCSVLAYYALKMAGDDPEAAHMARARQAILALGGAGRSNVFTRIRLALFDQIPWRSVPFSPVEVMLFPRWFPLHISNVAYWTRAVGIPLSILCSLKPKACNPAGVQVRELFTTPPEEERCYFPIRSRLNRLFIFFDRVGRFLEPHIPAAVRRYAVKKAESWIIERLNGEEGLGAIFPAIINAYLALACLGYPYDHPYQVDSRKALKKLLITRDGFTCCQLCQSPVWDTALCSIALQEVGGARVREKVSRALDWLMERQVLDLPGDWHQNHPGLKAGGWAFQLYNPYYPDLDDTAVVAIAMHLSGEIRYRESIERAAGWVRGMQSKNGGFGAFDSDNTAYFLNEIPFADHGALIDPPTSDVSARCAAFLAVIGYRDEVLESCLRYLRDEQEEDGSWFGRWGANYIYGTLSALIALVNGGDGRDLPHIRLAVDWLKKKQRSDGGWGEDCDTYHYPERRGGGYSSTPCQTAWAMFALMAVEKDISPEVERGAEYLLRSREQPDLLQESWFNAPAFPRVMYLKYHGYSLYFPLLALARYRTIRKARQNTASISLPTG